VPSELSDFQFSDDEFDDEFAGGSAHPSAAGDGGLDDLDWADDDPDPLAWLVPILWPDGDVDLEASDRPGPGWWASPSAQHPHILIPCESTAARRRSVRRYHDGFSPIRRLRSAGAEIMTGVPGLAERALAGSKVVPVPGPNATTTTLAEAGAPGAGSSGVIQGLADLLETPDLVVAISLSVEKSNRKPVLQLLDSSGRCLGWAKVGWNDRSDRLIGTEAAWLQRRPMAPLIMPELLHDTVVAGRRVVVTSGVDPVRLPRRRAGQLPDPSLFRAVAELGRDEQSGDGQADDRQAITDTTWWESVQEVWDGATDREQDAIEATVESCRDLRFEVGAWHGDLTPWNLMTSARGVQLIDWEFAADGAPVGFDLCHFHTQVGSEIKLDNASRALDRSARLSPQGLAALGLDAVNHLAVYRLYLVELIRRSMALRLEGYPVSRLTFGPAALIRLEQTAGWERSGGPTMLPEVFVS
jgi:hypothetical protein